jgi:signal transduction histidine kinase
MAHARSGISLLGTIPGAHRIATLSPHARLDVLLIGVVAGLTFGGMAWVVVPWMDPRIVAPALDIVLDTVATLVTLAVGALAWVRYREGGEAVALFQSAAFLVLATANGSTMVLATTGFDGGGGSTLTAPGQAPMYVFTLSRLLAATLLVMGGVEALRRRRPRPGGPFLAVMVLGAVAVVALLAAPAGLLPGLGSARSSAPPIGEEAAAQPGLTLLGAVASAVVAGLFLWAAALSRRLYRRDGSVGDAFLAVGLVFASFAQVATRAYPGLDAGVVAGGDVLGLVFDVILLLGIQAQMHATVGRLRMANADLARLRVLEVERAALEERARLSRELHDGLAQNLWLAKLKVGRLAALPQLGPEAAAVTEELAMAVETGLVEAQQAVAAMRLAGEPSGSLQDVLSRTVHEFSDRFGVRAELDCRTDLPCLPPRVQAEVLRIVQEALSNVRRHANATVVRVRASVDTDQLVVAVRDNGRGFQPAGVGRTAYGLASMRERAALIGGQLSIESAPHDGTRVRLVAPLVLVAPPLDVAAL